MNGSFKTSILVGATLLLIGGAAGFVGSRWLASIDERPEIIKQDPPLESYLSGLKLNGINYEVSEKGVKQWGFKAAEVIDNPKTQTTSLNGLHGGVYYKDGKPYLHLASGSATYHHPTRKLYMKNGVQVSGPDGLRFNASSLTWSADKRMLICPGPVQLQTAQGWVTSNGTLTADLKNQTFKLQQVKGEFNLDGVKGVPL